MKRNRILIAKVVLLMMFSCDNYVEQHNKDVFLRPSAFCIELDSSQYKEYYIEQLSVGSDSGESYFWDLDTLGLKSFCFDRNPRYENSFDVDVLKDSCSILLSLKDTNGILGSYSLHYTKSDSNTDKIYFRCRKL